MGPIQTARCSLLASAIAVTSAAAATLAYAQTTPTSGAMAEAPTATGALQEVIVTANRRVENQQTVPIATATFTGGQMRAVGITDIDQLGNNVAGAVFNREGNGAIPFIRGIGNPNASAGDEASVATYVDDVYLASNGNISIFNYNDIDRIEVDKGPQGTLFGRNATGGVIQIHTNDPSFAPEYVASVGAANYQTYSASMYASGGLSRTVAANFSAYWQGQYGGFGHNDVTADPSYTGHDAGGRVKVLWTPGDQTSVLLNLDHDWTWSQRGLDYRAAPGTDSEGGFPAPKGYYDYYSPFDVYATLNTSGASVKVNQGLGWSNLVSITALRYAYAPAFYNLGLGPMLGPPPSGIFSVEPVRPIDADDQSLTQELRLESPTSSSFKWILGFYYFHDIGSFDPVNLDIPAAMEDLNHIATQHTNSYAVFGDTTVAVTAGTHLTVGLRGTTSERSAYDSFMVNGMPVPAAYGRGSARFNSLTGRFIVDHRFSDDFMAYIAYNRGYKDGLFNLLDIGTPITSEPCTPANACDPPVKPETLDDLSIGEKAEFFDHRLRANTEAFYYWYKNLQVQEVVNDSSLTTNAARAVIKGVDLDITAKPLKDLLVVGSFAYLDGYFTDFPNGAYNVYQPGTGGNCAFAANNMCGLAPGSPFLPPHFDAATGTWNLAGNRTPNSPQFSMSWNLYYTKQTNIGAMDANLAWHHSQMYFFQPDNGMGQQPPSSPGYGAQPVLNLYDGSLGWISLNSKWEVRLWGRNLSNVKYSDFTLEIASATVNSAAPPRQYGITFTAHLT